MLAGSPLLFLAFPSIIDLSQKLDLCKMCLKCNKLSPNIYVSSENSGLICSKIRLFPWIFKIFSRVFFNFKSIDIFSNRLLPQNPTFASIVYHRENYCLQESDLFLFLAGDLPKLSSNHQQTPVIYMFLFKSSLHQFSNLVLFLYSVLSKLK